MNLVKIVEKNKKVILYLFFGGVTTLGCILVFYLCNVFLGINELIANVIAWTCGLLFAFFTNRKWVFEAQTESTVDFWRQLSSFTGGRLVTLGVEEVIILVFVTLLHGNSMVVKCVAQVVVVVLNYVISKWVVFRKEQEMQVL